MNDRRGVVRASGEKVSLRGDVPPRARHRAQIHQERHQILRRADVRRGAGMGHGLRVGSFTLRVTVAHQTGGLLKNTPVNARKCSCII